jgi:hypothetical protein
MIASTGTIAACHLESRTDPTGMGRYSFKKITGTNSRIFLFIVRYRVCKESIATVGETTSFFHQWHELTKLGHQHPNPRQQILNDIQDIVLKAIGKGINVCIAMDATKTWRLQINCFTSG